MTNKIKNKQNKEIGHGNFTMFNNRLLSRSFSSSILDEAEWKRLMHCMMNSNYYYGTSTYGRKDFCNYMSISSKKYKNTMKSLEDKHFVITESIAQKLTRTTLLMCPYTDRSGPVAFPYNGRLKQTKSSMEISREHFTQIPNEALEALLSDPGLYIIQIRLMLKLYQYTYLNIFNGVDPNIIYFNGNNVVVAERLLFDLDITQDQLECYLQDLMNANLLTIKQMEMENAKIGSEERILPKNMFSIKTTSYGIIQPTYTYERRRDNELN